MKTRAKISLILIVVLALVMVGTVAAQEGVDTSANTTTETSCAIEGAATEDWVVVAVDGDTVWLLTDADELCSVVLTGDSEADHPITKLLADYLAKQDGTDIADTVAENQVCALFTAASGEAQDTWDVVPCGTEGAMRVIGTNEDGTLIVLREEDGSLVADTSSMVDTTSQFWSDLLTALGEANANLGVDLIMDSEGNLVNFAEEITALRDEGLGYGVIVKLISMAEEAEQACAEQVAATQEATATEAVDPCAVTLQGLADEFQDGTGIGQMFKQYGKPAKVGVGHIRNDKENKGNGPKQETNGEETTDTTVTTNGPGNKPDVPPGQLKKQQDDQTTQSQNQSTGKPGKGNNGKAKGKP